ncbi:MAG: ABC transporter permease [Acidimicrobiia bacterium]|nr:ABC transporter permease [Acidimicrobiia bacterium]
MTAAVPTGSTSRGFAGQTRPVARWTVIARQELMDLWAGGKGLSILFGFTLVLSILAYLASADAGINLLDARESVGLVVTTSIALGTLGAMVVSADAISGERERDTLEALLVTPVPRRHIVVGKLLAATTVWVATLVVALPFAAVMAGGPGVMGDAVTVLLVSGSLSAAALTSLGLAISSVAMSNRTSLVVSLAVLLALAAPSQLPAVRSSTTLGPILIKLNPLSASLRLADNVLVRQEPWSDQMVYLISPALAAVVFTVAAVRLARRLELGGSR